MTRFLLVCDHASNHIPEELDNLGLPPSELQRHIAWDIGAAGVTSALSEILNAPSVFTRVSRLVIDCNRQLNAPGLIPPVSDGVVIPGNQNLSETGKADRVARWFEPYHNAIEAVLKCREDAIFISIHSMTPVLAGVSRPWQIALSSHEDRRLTDPVLAALRRQNEFTVGDNQPYDLDTAVDYTTPVHALRRGLLHLQVEFRQDEVATPETQRQWAQRFAQALLAGAAGINCANTMPSPPPERPANCTIDELRPEYDLAGLLKGGIRGKYAK